MHPNFIFTARQILWTLTFASQLLLLVVLLGRDRVKRFPVFTISISLYALRLLVEVLLAGRLAMLPFNEILLTLADVASIVSLLVLVEIARRSFGGLRWPFWAGGTAVLVVAAVAIEWVWGPWPVWKDMADFSLLGILRLMQLFAQKAGIFLDLITVGLGLAVVLFGRRFTGGWRTHAQKIAIGLSTVSLSWLAVQRGWQLVARSAHPTSQEEYEHLMDLGSRLVNANKAIYLAVLIWWIFWLWHDENGAGAVAAVEPETAEAVADGAGVPGDAVAAPEDETPKS